MSEVEQEVIIQKKMAHISLQHLEENYSDELDTNDHLRNLHSRMKLDIDFFNKDLEEIKNKDANPVRFYQRIYLELLDQQRAMLHKINHKAEFDEVLIRKYLSLIDIEEFKIREKLSE